MTEYVALQLFCARVDGSIFEVVAPSCSNAYNQLTGFHDHPMRWMLKRCDVQADRKVFERAGLL